MVTGRAGRMLAWVGGTLTHLPPNVRACAGRGATIAFLVAAGSLWSQETAAQTAIIRGTVTGGEGEPLEGVVVTLEDPDADATVVTRGVTGSRGQYWIAGVTEGSGYRVVFARLGLKTVRREDLSVAAGDTLTVDARLAEEAIKLDSMVVRGGGRSPLDARVRAPVTAAEIRRLAGIVTAQDLLRTLRPNAIASRVRECTRMELKVFIDGVRTDWPMDTLFFTRAEPDVQQRLLDGVPLFLQRLVLSRSRVGSMNRDDEAAREREGIAPPQSNMYAVWLALGKLRAEEIDKAEFLDCMDMSVPVLMRNAIWITTKRGVGDGW